MLIKSKNRKNSPLTNSKSSKIIILQFLLNKISIEEEFQKYNLITNIIQVHSQLLTDLKSSEKSFSPNLSTILLNFSDYFKTVKPYIKILDFIYEMMSLTDKSKIDPMVKTNKQTKIEWRWPQCHISLSLFNEFVEYPLFLEFNFSEHCFEIYQILYFQISSTQKKLQKNQGKFYKVFRRFSKRSIYWPQQSGYQNNFMFK